MPYIIRPRRIRSMAVAVLGSALLFGAVPAVANAAPCAKSPSSKLLEAYGDTSLYSLLTGSSFASGASGWSLSNAEVVAGESYEVNGGSNAVLVQPDGSAVSPPVCVSSEYPTFRFFARSFGGEQQQSWPWGDGGQSSLNVSLRWKDMFGFTHNSNVGTIQSSSSWELSPALKLASALPLWMRGSTLTVRLVFQASGSASWAVADVFIDPYSR